MLTRVIIKNLKRFAVADIDLGPNVVFVGPNNSGKTTALQALALWHYGLRRWLEERSEGVAPERRTGVAINRKELLALPVPKARQLWRDLRVQTGTEHVLIEIVVEGVTSGAVWKCGLEFDHANEESLYVRAAKVGSSDPKPRMPVPREAAAERIVFLPPLSGLSLAEERLPEGAINVRIGEGRTAEVLRNLCYTLHTGPDGEAHWKVLCSRMKTLFGVELDAPEFDPSRGAVTLAYREKRGAHLDIGCAGRGLHQTLLLLAHLGAHPRSVLLLDEPDAHLEFLRQRQIYRIVTDAASESGGQVIAATHSEVLLNDAADRHVVVAFVGSTPRRIDDRGSQVMKALKDVGFEQYLQAEEKGWVLYLEGSTDLSILQAFAARLDHPAKEDLEQPFLKEVGNVAVHAREHFHALRVAKPDLIGFALFDRRVEPPAAGTNLREVSWKRREIENYVCTPSALRAYAAALAGSMQAGPLFQDSVAGQFREAMDAAMAAWIAPAILNDPSSSRWRDAKASDEILDPVFESFFQRLGIPNLMNKSDYHELARHVPLAELDPEIRGVLDALHACARLAKPALGE